MNQLQVMALKGGERIKVWCDCGYQKGTFMRHIHGADSAAWIAFDDKQIEGKGLTGTKVYTGLQFTEEYFEEKNKDMPRFILLTEEELNAELIEGMEVAQ